MPPLVPLPGLAAARRATRRTWLELMLVALIPGWSMARALSGFATIGEQPLSYDAPNIWSVGVRLPGLSTAPLAGLAMAGASGTAVWLAAHFSARPPRDTLAAALLIALALPGLLPGMRPLDFVLAGVIGIAQAGRERNRASVALAALIAGGIVHASADVAPLGAVPMIVATALIAQRFFVLPANDNGSPLNLLAEFPG